MAYKRKNGSIDYQALVNEAERIDPDENPEKVVALLEPYRNDSNNNSMFYFFLGDAYKDLGREKEAIDLYNKSIRLDSNNCLPYAGLAQIYHKKGKNKQTNKFIHEFLIRAEPFMEKLLKDGPKK